MAHFARAVVADAGVDLVLVVHDERAVTDQGLVQRFPAEHQELGLFQRVKPHDITAAVVERELFVAQQVSTFAFELTLNHVNKGIVRWVDRQVQSPS